MHCSGCGYLPVEHDSAGRCPLCACGKLPSEHGQVTNPPAPFRGIGATGMACYPPSPLLAFSVIGAAFRGTIRLQFICPDKPRTASGAMPQLRRGEYRVAEPTQYERRPGWGDVLFPVVARGTATPPPSPVPRVPARYTESLDEIAPAALRLGKRASAAGWTVDPWYAVSGAGAEKSMLALRRGELRAVATWDRPEGGTWKPAKVIAGRAGGAWSLIGVRQFAELLTWQGEETG